MQIKHYLKSDINSLQKSDDNGYDVGCGPYLLTTCSGIDFLGSLSCPSSKHGLEGKSHDGYKYYVPKILGMVDLKYKADNVATWIYKFVRCGQVHEAMVKFKVIIGKKWGREYHLKLLSIPEKTDEIKNRKKVIYFNPRIFAEDFVDSLAHFEKLFEVDENIERMYCNLIKAKKKTEEDLNKIWNTLDVNQVDVNDKICDNIYEYITSASPYTKPLGKLRDDWLDLIK